MVDISASYTFFVHSHPQKAEAHWGAPNSNRQLILDLLIVPNLTTPQEYLYSKEYLIFNYQLVMGSFENLIIIIQPGNGEGWKTSAVYYYCPGPGVKR